MKPTIDIDQHSGFCFGVVNAIEKAESQLDKMGSLYCLGDIVHNSQEVDRLKKKGLITIDHDQFRQLKNVKVLLRAHGEPPVTYQWAKENGIEIEDATCPVVLRLQKQIKEDYDNGDPQKERIVIYGKAGHAEVNGLVGQTNGEALVVESIQDLDKIDYSKDIRLYAQTTQSVDGFQQMVKLIQNRLEGDKKLFYKDTICRKVANRLPNIRHFAKEHDLILFVSGLKSSNGKVLYHECLQVNPNSFLITHPDEIDPRWLQGKERIGICGATSTPKWLMEEVSKRLEDYFSNENSLLPIK